MDGTWERKIAVNYFLYFIFPSFWNFNVWLSIHNKKKKKNLFFKASDLKSPRHHLLVVERQKSVLTYIHSHKMQKWSEDEEIQNP